MGNDGGWKMGDMGATGMTSDGARVDVLT